MRQGFAGVAVVAVLATGWCQQNEAISGRHGRESRDADVNAFQGAMHAKPSVRDAALRNLVATSYEEAAKDALVALIRLHAADAEALGLSLLPALSDLNMRSILGAAGMTQDSHLRMTLARGVLERIVNDRVEAAIQRGDELGRSAAGMAAMLLASSANAADRDVVGRVAMLRPHDPGLWLALAKIGISDPQKFSLASSVMMDAKVPSRARLAAAAALAPGDPKAREFVVGILTSFFSKFGPVDAGAIIGRAMGQPPESYDSKQAGQFMLGLGAVIALEFLQTDDAERLTFEYIDVPNELVRRALGLIAVMRWPERYMKLRPSHVEERTKLLAALTVYHPELLPRVQSLVSSEELEKTRSRLMSDGVEAVFWLPGGSGLVF